MADDIIPLIICGGAGTRLWPLSRGSKPKQFLAFGDKHTLLQQTLLRVQGKAFDPSPIIVGANDQRFLIAENLREIGVNANIVLEPMPRNSCAAIAAGCFQAMTRDPDALVLVLAADHAINDTKQFQQECVNASEAARLGKLVTFGIRPTRPATGYGYIKPGAKLNAGKAFSVSSFVEKPDASTALSYLADGYLWNSGNFLFKAKTFLDELAAQSSKIHTATLSAYRGAEAGEVFIELEEQAFSQNPSISVDYAVMEKTQKAAVLPVGYQWSDVGSWSSIWEISEKDDNGNVMIGDVTVESSRDNIVHTEDKKVTMRGLEGLAVIVSGNQILIQPKDYSENFNEMAREQAPDKPKEP